MSIENTLTLLLAAGLLLGAVALRAAVHGGIRLYVILREWIEPASSTWSSAPTQRVITLPKPSPSKKRTTRPEDTGPLAQAMASARRS